MKLPHLHFTTETSFTEDVCYEETTNHFSLSVFWIFISNDTLASKALTELPFLQNENQSRNFLRDTSDTNRDPSDAFIITIKTDNPGSSGDDQFTLPWIGTYDVDWGDGISDTRA